MLNQTTPVPNEFFEHIPNLSDAELRVLLLIIRQTLGWVAYNNQRKQRDRLTYNYIIKRTGLYRTVLSSTIQSLVDKGLIRVTNPAGKELVSAKERRGQVVLYYEYVRKHIFQK